MNTKIYKILASKSQMLGNDTNYYSQVESQIEKIMEEHFPKGSGFDSGCTLNLNNPNGINLIINIPYHCMNDDGYYDGWVYPSLMITPSLSQDYNMKLNWHGYRGKYKFLLSDYFYDVFAEVLEKEITYPTIDVEAGY